MVKYSQILNLGISMDSFDKHILSILQKDCTQSTSDVAEQVGLSTTPCWRRIQAMEKSGIITKRVALADPEKLNVGLSIFVMIKTNQHNPKWLDAFAKIAMAFPEIVEAYRMSGEVDYLLRVVVPDMKAYDRFYQQLITQADFSDISSSFSMQEIKYTTALPVDYI
jgi:Lrp/AsnC family transcriptional regulator